MGKRIGALGLVNYRDHPTDRNYKVFNFNTLREAELFETYLTKNKIWFERDKDDTEDNDELYLFAVEQKNFERAQRGNFEVSAKVRKHIIPNAILRYGLVLFFFGILALAIIGYVKK